MKTHEKETNNPTSFTLISVYYVNDFQLTKIVPREAVINIYKGFT